VRISLLILLLFPGLASAFWTGVSLELGNTDSDWRFDSDTREAQISELNFQIEEKTDTDLTVGANIGYFDLRVVADSDSAAQTMKFDGQYLGIYLRQSFDISDHVGLQLLFSVRYTTGNESGVDEDEDEADVEWTQSGVEFGVSFRYANLRISPYAAYQDIDGDINGDSTDVFELEDSLTQGIRFDYFVEDSAFIRFEFVTGARNGGYLNFVRRY